MSEECALWLNTKAALIVMRIVVGKKDKLDVVLNVGWEVIRLSPTDARLISTDAFSGISVGGIWTHNLV